MRCRAGRQFESTPRERTGRCRRVGPDLVVHVAFDSFVSQPPKLPKSINGVRPSLYARKLRRRNGLSGPITTAFSSSQSPPPSCENCSGGEVGEALRQGFGVLVRGVFGETVVSHGFVSQMGFFVQGIRVPFRGPFGGGKGRGFAYAGAREVLRKVEKQTLHWMSFAVSLTLSWDLASLPAFFKARSRFWADLAPCVCEGGGQQAASDK